MARVAVIGEPLRIHEYGLTGAIMCPATDQAEAVLAWREMPEDIEVAVLTPSAARWLASEIAGRPRVLPVLLAEAARRHLLFGPDSLSGICPDVPPGLGPDVRREPGPVALPDVLPEPGPVAPPDVLPELGPVALPDVRPDAAPPEPRMPPEPGIRPER